MYLPSHVLYYNNNEQNLKNNSDRDVAYDGVKEENVQWHRVKDLKSVDFQKKECLSLFF